LREGSRSCKGSYDLNGLRFKGSYSPSDKQFTLAIVRYDQELLEEVGATILESTQTLDSMNYLKLAVTVPAEAQEAATRLEFYCRVHWEKPVDQVIAP
jgi:hypothetical protein